MESLTSLLLALAWCGFATAVHRAFPRIDRILSLAERINPSRWPGISAGLARAEGIIRDQSESDSLSRGETKDHLRS